MYTGNMSRLIVKLSVALTLLVAATHQNPAIYSAPAPPACQCYDPFYEIQSGTPKNFNIENLSSTTLLFLDTTTPVLKQNRIQTSGLAKITVGKGAGANTIRLARTVSPTYLTLTSNAPAYSTPAVDWTYRFDGSYKCAFTLKLNGRYLCKTGAEVSGATQFITKTSVGTNSDCYFRAFELA